MKKSAASLRGKYIVSTRSAGGNNAWKKYFEEQGAKVYHFPTIEIICVKPNAKIKTVLKRLNSFDQVVVTSIEGLQAMRSLAEKLGIAISQKHFPRLAVLGSETARRARAMGYRVVFQPSVANSTALARELILVGHPSVLLLRSTIASKKLPEILAARGAKVIDLAVYKTVSIKNSDAHFLVLLRKGKINYFTFASPSAVRGFFDRVDKKLHKKVLAIPVVAIGPNVSKALKKAGFKTIRVAVEPTPKGMAEAMI